MEVSLVKINAESRLFLRICSHIIFMICLNIWAGLQMTTVTLALIKAA